MNLSCKSKSVENTLRRDFLLKEFLLTRNHAEFSFADSAGQDYSLELGVQEDGSFLASISKKGSVLPHKHYLSRVSAYYIQRTLRGLN